MPTHTKLEKALASAQGLCADLKTFSRYWWSICKTNV